MDLYRDQFSTWWAVDLLQVLANCPGRRVLDVSMFELRALNKKFSCVALVVAVSNANEIDRCPGLSFATLLDVRVVHTPPLTHARTCAAA